MPSHNHWEIEADIERGGPGATRSLLEAELKELRAILDIGWRA